MPKYSRNQFEGYTHRFIVEFYVGREKKTTIQIYSDSDSYGELTEFLNLHRKECVREFNISHRSSKEDDEISLEIINYVL